MLPRGARALDVGCGGGRHSVLLAERYDHVDAIDLDPSMIELARSSNARPNIDYRVADLFDTTAPYDLVFSTAMLHHVDDVGAALGHIRSLVAPGGRAVLVDVVAPVADRFFTPTQFDELFGGALPGSAFVGLGHLRAAVWLV